jgi:hypothetical protein
VKYRELGKTGLKVSQLGFGAMRLPMNGETIDRQKAIPMIHRAFEAGVNYIDTAVMYSKGDSQRVVGEALKGWREKIVVSTKNHYKGEEESEWWGHLEDSLQRLDVECIDIYHHHGVNGKTFPDDILPRVRKWMEKARNQGLVKHIACSFHDGPDALKAIVDSGYPEVLTVQYNILNRELEDAIAHAHDNGIGVVVMGPVGGGRLGVRSEELENMIPGVARVPELALRFVLSNPNVDVALSGMSTMQHVEENVATCDRDVTLSAEDLQAIDEHMRRLEKMAELYCTGCKYCMPCEPAEVNIPAIFELHNRGKVYGLWDSAQADYNTIGKVPWRKGKTAEACIECGACESKCPQNIPIRKQLAEAHKALHTPE